MADSPEYEEWKRKNGHNGNGKSNNQPVVSLFTDETIASKLLSNTDNDLQEPSMAGFANGLHDEAKLDHYTEYENKQDVLRMNTFIGCARNVSTNIFGDSEHIKESVRQLLESAHDHKLHMRAHKRKGALESVSVARGGYDVVKSTRDLEKQLKLRH